MRVVKAGTADVSVVIRIIDSTDGTPETGVVWNTAGIDLQYRREGAVSTAITEATLAALTTAHTDGGFLHIGNGYYRLDLPDAACAAGVTGVLVHGTVTGMVVIGEYIQLVTYDPFDSVRLGLTALPNAVPGAAGGVFIAGTNAATSITTALTANIIGDITGNLSTVLGSLADAAADGDPTSADTVMQYVKQLINTLVGTAGIPTFPAEAAPGNAVSLAEVIRAIHTDVTGLNGAAMRGTDSAALASVCTETRLAELDAANLPTDVAAVKTDTGNLVTRITATLFSGITSLAQWLGLLAGKQAGNATALTEIKATGAGAGTFSETTDSLEAIRDTAPLGTAMRGTDSAALASVCTEGRLAELDAANIPADLTNALADTNELQTDWADGGRLDLLLDAISGATNPGIIFRGTVTADNPGVSFTIASLAGLGAGAFVDVNTPWYAYVFRDAGGAGAAPQGEQQQITGYTTATGLFTTAAFTVSVATGDDIMIMRERIASIPEIKAVTDKLDSMVEVVP